MKAEFIEARKLYHAAALEEFKAMRAELVAMAAEQKKVIALVTTSLPVVGIVTSYVGKGAFVVPVWLLFIASLFYSILSLFMLRHYWTVTAIAEYQRDDLVPRITDNLKSFHDTELADLYPPIQWEDKGHALYSTPWWLKPLEASALLMSLLPASTLCYVGWAQLWGTGNLPYKYVLGVVALLSVLYAALAGVAVFARLGKPGMGLKNPNLYAFTKRIVK